MMSIKNKYKECASRLCWGIAAAVMAAPMLTACADWDDHYDADSSVAESQKATLWQNIEQNGNLIQFAELLRKTGFNEQLSASQTYTVWAPQDNSFDYSTLLSQNNSRVLKQFVQNHVARNSYPASGELNKNINMLNEKVMHFVGNGNYTIQDVSLSQPNVGSANGLLHVINGRIPFRQNIYESLNNEEYALDSISKFILSFDEKKIDESKSVEGPVLNGEQTYLDTVYYENNDLMNLLDAYVNSEDSSYTMLVPTNEAWNKARATITKYFNFLPKFEYLEDTSEKNSVEVKVKDPEFMRDSLSNLLLAASLFYNNNLFDNGKLKSLKDGENPKVDSLMSTARWKMYSDDAADLFANAHRVDKSNGAIWVVDTLQMRTWTGWNPELRIEAEYSTYWSGYKDVANSPEAVTVNTKNPNVAGRVSNGRYVEVAPISSVSNPEIDFFLPNVRSAEYSVYVVMVPANIHTADYAGKVQKNLITFTLGYADENGKIKETAYSNLETHTDSSAVDTLYVGDITFPVSYVGLASSSAMYAPYLRVRSRVSSRQSALYDRTLRIDCIILRPKELDNYIKDHPSYVYDRDLY